MVPGRLLLESCWRVSEATYHERIKRLEPQQGDIIYSREGERLGIASPVGIERICLGQRVMHLRPKVDVDGWYLVWAMNSLPFYQQVLNSISSTTSPHVNLDAIRKFLVWRPTTQEQIRIAGCFDVFDRKIQAEERANAKNLYVKQGLMQGLLTGRVRVKVEQEN